MIMESTNEKALFEVAEIHLSYKSKVKASLRPKITSSRDAYQVLKKYWDDDKIEFVEQFKVMLLNRANHVIGLFNAPSGTSTGTIAGPKLIFVAAIKANACGIVISHNHPSGNLQASQADISLTSKLKEAVNSWKFRFLITSSLPANHIIHSLMKDTCSPLWETGDYPIFLYFTTFHLVTQRHG
jgi:DNA repair protein RadC